MAMIENSKSKRVRRKLLQDQPTLAEALESADQHALKVGKQTTAKVTVKQEINKTAVDKNRAKLCFNCKKHWPHQGVQRNAPPLENSVHDVSLSMGISEEIEDVKITAEKTKISKLKRRSENYPKFA